MVETTFLGLAWGGTGFGCLVPEDFHASCCQLQTAHWPGLIAPTWLMWAGCWWEAVPRHLLAVGDLAWGGTGFGCLWPNEHWHERQVFLASCCRHQAVQGVWERELDVLPQPGSWREAEKLELNQIFGTKSKIELVKFTNKK